ncbi:hypothetical protein BX070DRAFT_192977, partial [Coemansia spiralis]
MSSIEQVNYDNIASDEFLSETDIIESAELSDNKRRDLLSQRFARTASSGDAAALERMWKTCQGSQWVDIDYRDDQGSTPLICASCFGHTRIGELLLKYGANVDTQDNSGWTALMWATTNQNEDLVRVLLENGASSSAKTARGHTAINIASSSLSAGSDSESFQHDGETKEPQVFNWDTLSLDQMYVISPAAVPQFLHTVVKDIRPEQWIHSKVVPEYKFVPASMIFLAARFAHYLDMPDFLESFIADAIASIIHEVQTHKSDPVALAFWIANIQTLIYFFKRDSTLVQSTSDAQGRMSECIQDAYSLLIRAVEAEIEPLIDVSMLAYESMPELFADVKFEAERSQRLSMFFFDTRRQSTSIFNLVSSPSPRTITYVLECLLDVLEMCEIHPHVVWSIMRQLFCYLGSEMFNRVLTTRDFCSRSRAMQIRMNLTQLSDWVRTNSNRIPVYFSPLVELLELLQCLTHLPDLPEYFETTAKMQSLNILQQETAVANYRYEVQERKISAEVVEYLESVAKE